MKALTVLFAHFFLLLSFAGDAQTKPLIISTDSTTQTKNPAFAKDTMLKVAGNDTLKIVPHHSAKTASLRSLVIPGWGQAYNREYWKIPIVYGAIGTMAGIYIYNDSWYKKTKKAYEIRINKDTANFPAIDPKLQPLSAASLQSYRNTFRRDRDYSALWFLIMWGLNIVDATVFAHLKEFDVSEDLSLRVNPSLSNQRKGVSLVLGFKAPVKRTLATSW